MATSHTCPRCGNRNRPVARFCAFCGLVVTARGAQAGRIKHPTPLAAPAGFEPVADAIDLFFRFESAWGGPRVLDTENIGLVLFNAGYPLKNATLSIEGNREGGGERLEVEHIVPEAPRGRTVRVEIPSWEMAAAVKRVNARLVSAEFEMESDETT